jgi:peptidoglycan/xylan/chitin deacetylase (PgdA/CDA1 family)
MQKVAYLTIDDGPSEHTEEYLTYLRINSIPAIMFFIGEHLKRFPDIAVSAINNGIIIGNHTMSHPRLSTCTLKASINEIEQMERLIDDIYLKAQCQRPCKLFRFPYGDKGGSNSEKIQAYLKESGFKKIDPTRITYPWYYELMIDRGNDVLWTFDFEDYKLSSKTQSITEEEILHRIRNKEPVHGGSLHNTHSHDILLMHDLPDSNIRLKGYFTKILDDVRQLNVTFEMPNFIC